MPSFTLPFDLEKNIALLILLGVLDHLVLKPLITHGARKKQKDATDQPSWERAQRSISPARWFFIHAIANFMVVLTALGSMWSVLRDPLNCMDSSVLNERGPFGNASAWPMIIINSVHVYHMIGGFNLSSADYFHHGLL
tara:strand:- start:55 stop:471 length:417 start_codon:yes stop_codon:yes gene_type:complete